MELPQVIAPTMVVDTGWDHLKSPRIVEHEASGHRVLVYWREQKNELGVALVTGDFEVGEVTLVDFEMKISVYDFIFNNTIYCDHSEKIYIMGRTALDQPTFIMTYAMIDVVDDAAVVSIHTVDCGTARTYDDNETDSVCLDDGYIIRMSAMIAATSLFRADATTGLITFVSQLIGLHGYDDTDVFTNLITIKLSQIDANRAMLIGIDRRPSPYLIDRAQAMIMSRSGSTLSVSSVTELYLDSSLIDRDYNKGTALHKISDTKWLAFFMGPNREQGQVCILGLSGTTITKLDETTFFEPISTDIYNPLIIFDSERELVLLSYTTPWETYQRQRLIAFDYNDLDGTPEVIYTIDQEGTDWMTRIGSTGHGIYFEESVWRILVVYSGGTPRNGDDYNIMFGGLQYPPSYFWTNFSGQTERFEE